MAQPIIFYDIPNVLPLPKRSWSRNCLRTRLALNYKELPYKTVWVEYADVQKVMKNIGATPTTPAADGTLRYTLPTIHDPNTGKIISDSIAIARYLDAQYPERPLFAAGTEAQQVEFTNSSFGIVNSVFPLLVHRQYFNFSEHSKPAFEAVLLPRIGGPPFVERESFHDGQLPEISTAFGRLADSLAEVNEKCGGQLIGEGLSFAEIITVAYVVFAWTVLQKEQVKSILDQDGCKLGALWDKARPYMIVDEGDVYIIKK